MTLQRKIIFSFILSASVIAALLVMMFLNFVEIRKEIRFLELSDSIRTKSLQLRRHEKNLFLYMESSEANEVHRYINEINSLLRSEPKYASMPPFRLVESKTNEYQFLFISIEDDIRWGRSMLPILSLTGEYAACGPFITSTFIERPLLNAGFIETHIAEKNDAPERLRELSGKITLLRKAGEEIVEASKDIDVIARQKVERAISISQIAALVMFPLFFAVGIAGTFVISRNTVRHIQKLAEALGKAGEGKYITLPVQPGDDEVSRLVTAFNKMENDLMDREIEIEGKNEELYQSRKLAFLGTMASGVAHELNNPLNNIYLSAQILNREISADASPKVKETVGDIYSETLRVKKIVEDLLEFSRSKMPEKKDIDIAALISAVLEQAAAKNPGIKKVFNAEGRTWAMADRHMIGQVFTNLIDNAVEAMDRNGTISIRIRESGGGIAIEVRDTGRGIHPSLLGKIFEPFYTTKERGTGLGLAIVYSIIEKHGGRIEVESEMDKGTAFLVTLPGRANR